jgi:16S rRNA (cytidine1402-2'-O)-methyltransferase
LDSSIVFFISSKKINRVIPYLQKNFTGRKMLICREMTKYYEEFIRSDVDEINKLNFKLKGELTIVISEKKIDKKTSQSLCESDKTIINKMINKLSIKEIISLINQKNRISKKEIYNYCIKLKNED